MNKRSQTNTNLRRVLCGSAAIALVLSGPLLPHVTGVDGLAYAQTTSGHRGGSDSGSGSGRMPSGTSGQDMGQGGSTGTHGHFGQGGSSESTSGTEGTSSDRQGPRFGGGANSRKPESGTQGGRPAWAKEGIPEVELGRLSVARSPSHVLQHALSEVVSNWTTMGSTVLTLTADGQPTLTMTVAELYSKPSAEFARIVQTYYPSIVRIDSPLENLALLKNYATTGSVDLSGVTPASRLDLMAIFLGSAADKTIAITPDTVTAMQVILGLPALSPEQTATLASEADAVRLAILAGHDA